MANNYNIFYNNSTGQVVLKENKNSILPIKDVEFAKKIDELSKFANIDSPNDVKIEKEKEIVKRPSSLDNLINTDIRRKPDNVIVNKKNLIYGIKKTILSDFNFSNYSSNSNDFKIGINKSSSNNNIIFDTFYIFPNISEINTKNETNTINEKKVEIFKHSINKIDKQYFPVDFIPCGFTIPLKKNNIAYSKIIISNIFWNIFQSIDNERYENNELLCIIPDKTEFIYKKINLQINFELHSQLSSNKARKFSDKILPYKNERIKNINPSNSCLYSVESFTIDTLNGASFENIEIELNEELDLQCALLCVRVSIPNESLNSLKGFDKNDKIFCGHVPFSQIIVNFDYDLI